jgi:hypothetical protein
LNGAYFSRAMRSQVSSTAIGEGLARVVVGKARSNRAMLLFGRQRQLHRQRRSRREQLRPARGHAERGQS